MIARSPLEFTPLYNVNATNKSGLTVCWRQCLKHIIRDTNKGQPRREADLERVGLDVREEQVHNIYFGLACLPDLLRGPIRLHRSLEGGVGQEHCRQGRLGAVRAARDGSNPMVGRELLLLSVLVFKVHKW